MGPHLQTTGARKLFPHAARYRITGYTPADPRHGGVSRVVLRLAEQGDAASCSRHGRTAAPERYTFHVLGDAKQVLARCVNIFYQAVDILVLDQQTTRAYRGIDPGHGMFLVSIQWDRPVHGVPTRFEFLVRRDVLHKKARRSP